MQPVFGKRGFDVITNSFFVEEEYAYTDFWGEEQKGSHSFSFDSFDSYFEHLSGDIYENSCYTFCHLPESIIASRKINLAALMERKAFTDETIDDYSFETLIAYLNNGLTNCSFSDALDQRKSKPKIYMDKKTLLVQQDIKRTLFVEKYYENKLFCVVQQWRNDSGVLIGEYSHRVHYFFDYVAFLKNDLSGANFILCDGLAYLEQWDSILFTGAKMRSSLCEKFGLQFNAYEIDNDLMDTFELTEKNESETALTLYSSRDELPEDAERNCTLYDYRYADKYKIVHYISDIHLLHRLKECRSKEDVIYLIQKIVDTLVQKTKGLLLFGGDVASDYTIFSIFVNALYKALCKKTTVVFTLGNHELWNFPGQTIDEIVSTYRTFLGKYGMYLLQNDILYTEDCDYIEKCDLSDASCTKTQLLKYAELSEMDITQVASRLKKARFVILGGIGFSGYNLSFNADSGIYKNIVNRNVEIAESNKFERLYNNLRCVLSTRNTIIFTHMPKSDWCYEAQPDKHFVYVNGHTHRNFFYDDGEYRVYSDNQIGYRNDSLRFKTFLLDNNYDRFADYDDGIFEIDADQYRDFYRGKIIPMNFNRKVYTLYLLKKNGYYCFVHKSLRNTLTILNGGAMRTLENRSVQYYYDNMDAMISTIKKPLDKFTSFQRQIADNIKMIGGTGKIHGCIIDIDYFNHIYVNPVNLAITGYWALDIIDKVVYPSIPALLQQNRPEIYDKYTKLLEGTKANPFALSPQKDIALLPQEYLDTDIYIASREIKKMQKLSSNILSSWYEDALHKNAQIESAK